MTYADLEKLLQTRRSIRYFSDVPVTKDVLLKIVEAGRLAPSVENTQPWHFHVVTDLALKSALMETSCYGNFVAGASAFLVVTCDRTAQGSAHGMIWNPREMEYSCVSAMHAMMLAATTLDIGSCWVSLHHGPAHNILKLKDHQVVVGGLMLGHMKKDDELPSRDHDRHPIEKMVTWH